MGEKELCGGLVRLHVLHHASREPVFGLGLMEELAHHGYRLSPGTLYPILHGLEKNGQLRSSMEKVGKTSRRTYVVTTAGRKALRAAKERVWELFRELFEEELPHGLLEGAMRDRRTTKGKGERK
jgi:DNA-binding PadR family transcriptional regulator